MSNKICLVVTTVSDGSFLDVYANNLAKEEMAPDTLIIVIPDCKTHPKLFQKSKEIKRQGLKILCPTLEEQDQFLHKLGGIQHIIPYDSNNRRNIGFLMALEKGCEVLISVDDDNLPVTSSNFFREHLIVTQSSVEIETVHSANKWFNMCDLLNLQKQFQY